MLTMLDSLLLLASAMGVEEDESPAEAHEISLLGLTLILLCNTVGILTANVEITRANQENITAAVNATYEIFKKLPQEKHVYHDTLSKVLEALQIKSNPAATEISAKVSSELSTESSAHGVIYNLAIKLLDGVFGLLNLLDDKDANSINSKLSPILESLHCTLGSINRVLDPLPGIDPIEEELYNVHLTPHKLPIATTCISEPRVSYCCRDYKQLTTQ
ncbi:hypothetical protein [Anaplasma bovis]|uniref:hypothetical protein n=1 Tax=Anaplasma bovis TaxID=186733 RepID=UPI002FF2D04C